MIVDFMHLNMSLTNPGCVLATFYSKVITTVSVNDSSVPPDLNFSGRI